MALPISMMVLSPLRKTRRRRRRTSNKTMMMAAARSTPSVSFNNVNILLVAAVSMLILLVSRQNHQQHYHHQSHQGDAIVSASSNSDADGRHGGFVVHAFSTLLTTTPTMSMSRDITERRGLTVSARSIFCSPVSAHTRQFVSLQLATSGLTTSQRGPKCKPLLSFVWSPADTSTVLLGRQRQVDPRRHGFVLAASPQNDMFEDKEGDGDDDDDNDGWGSTPSSSTSSSASSKSMAEMTNELRSLQQQTNTNNQSTTNTVPRTNQNNQEQERDLFIPIFAIVSLMGLFGSYGYEMVRLYSRGELYLPWMDN